MTTEQADAPTKPLVIGLDLWFFGRAARVVFGLFAIVAAITDLATGNYDVGFFPQVLGYVAVLLVYYLVLHGALGERALGRIDPFLATVLVLGPLLLAIAVLPRAMFVAAELYGGASLILTAVIGYGGCEVLALSTVLFGRRYVVYGPNNIIDAAERPMRDTGDPVVRAAAIVALVVAAYFVIVDPLLDQYVAMKVVPELWALLLLAPATVFTERAWRSRAEPGRAWGLALGAAALVAGALILAGVVKENLVFWAAILGRLLFIAGARAVRVTSFRGTRAARWTAIVLVGLPVLATVVLVVADTQRYVLLLPLATWLAKAVVITLTPLLLGLAWWLLTRSRRASILCVVTTIVIQIAAAAYGGWLLLISGLDGEIPQEGPQVIAASPDARFELVRTVHDEPFGAGRHESLWLRSRTGLTSRQSRTELLRCHSSFYEYEGRVSRRVITSADVSFIDEITVKIIASTGSDVVRFDPTTLQAQRTVKLDLCPTLIGS